MRIGHAVHATKVLIDYVLNRIRHCTLWRRYIRVHESQKIESLLGKCIHIHSIMPKRPRKRDPEREKHAQTLLDAVFAGRYDEADAILTEHSLDKGDFKQFNTAPSSGESPVAKALERHDVKMITWLNQKLGIRHSELYRQFSIACKEGNLEWAKCLNDEFDCAKSGMIYFPEIIRKVACNGDIKMLGYLLEVTDGHIQGGMVLTDHVFSWTMATQGNPQISQMLVSKFWPGLPKVAQQADYFKEPSK
jgi:hypothetical protein